MKERYVYLLMLWEWNVFKVFTHTKPSEYL